MSFEMNHHRVPDWLIKFIWLLVILLFASGYFLLNKPRGPVHVLETTVDDWIPLIPAFVFAYEPVAQRLHPSGLLMTPPGS